MDTSYIEVGKGYISQMNFLLAICLLFLVLCIYRSYRQGLLRSLFSLFSGILIFAIAFMVTPLVSDFMQRNTPVFAYTQESVQEYMVDSMNETLSSEETDQLAEDELTAQLAAAGLNLPEALLSKIADHMTDEGKEMLLSSQIPVRLSAAVAGGIVWLISFIISLILASILIHFIVSALDLVARLPGLHMVNHILGGAFGIIRWLFYMYLFLFILSLMPSSPWSSFLLYYIENNSTLEYLYKHNLLVSAVSTVVKSVF